MASATLADISKLTKCLEAAFKSSPEARQALRAWLDELEKATEPKQVPPVKEEKAQVPAPVQYHGVVSFHNVRPEDYRWTYEESHPKSRMVVYERGMPSGMATLRYYYTAGTVQLGYWVLDSDGGEWDSECESSEESYEWRRVTETFRGLSDDEFRKLLKNPPTFYGKGE